MSVLTVAPTYKLSVPSSKTMSLLCGLLIPSVRPVGRR
jgi:hypothetical protein